MNDNYGRGGNQEGDANTTRMSPQPQPEQPGYWQPPTYAAPPQPYAAPAPMPDNLKPVPYEQPKQAAGPVQYGAAPYQPSITPLAGGSAGYNPADLIRREAEKRVKAKEVFRAHLTTYLFVISLLITIWLITSLASGHPYYFWPVWPAFGWGIAVFAQYMTAYGGQQTNPLRREQQIAEEMRRMEASYPPPTPGSLPSDQQSDWQQRFDQEQQGRNR